MNVFLFTLDYQPKLEFFLRNDKDFIWNENPNQSNKGEKRGLQNSVLII